MQVVDPTKCDRSIKSKIELCVGGLAPRALVANFRAKLNGVPNRFDFDLVNVRDDPRFPNDILGYRDSCSGDSGSPLWTPVIDQKVEFQSTMSQSICLRKTLQGRPRAVVIGVTSRGAAICGEVDTPAIYSRIKSHLDWIKQSIHTLSDGGR